jgi:hypothetical protein
MKCIATTLSRKENRMLFRQDMQIYAMKCQQRLRLQKGKNPLKDPVTLGTGQM